MQLVALCVVVCSVGLASCDFGFSGLMTGLVAVGGGVMYKMSEYVGDHWERCSDKFVPENLDNLERLEVGLKERLHGQHLILQQLIPALRTHIQHQPKKALVISMNGWTGVGKNYVAQMIVDMLYRKKSGSKFVHEFKGLYHFPKQSPEMLEKYRDMVQKRVENSVKLCERSLFVFDEVDKIAPGVLDVLKPYLDFHQLIDGVDYRKAIFVFISNIGGGSITSKYLELWSKGVTRHNMRYADFEPLLRRELFDYEGGFQDSGVITSQLVSLYLPFLPLEREHVVLCIQDEMKDLSIPNTEKDVNAILDNLEYDKTGKFSSSGCKRVHQLVGVLNTGRQISFVEP